MVVKYVSIVIKTNKFKYSFKHGEDDELLEEPQEEEQIAVDAPHVRCDLGRDIHLVKLPSFMTVEPK